MSMPSEELQLLIAGYVLGDLSPEEAAEFERLLRQDPAIAQEVAQMQNALEMSYAPPEVTPPSHLRSVILDKAQVAGAEMNTQPAFRSRKTLSWRSGLEVAAAVLIVALGINNYRLSQALQTSQAETQRYAALTYILDATESNSQAAATVVVNPNTLEATITVQNLPPLPPGKVYALWTVLTPNAPFTTDQKQAILTETFQVDERGNLAQTSSVSKVYRSKELVTKIAVTVEDVNAPQKHTGAPIIITGL
ncbi:anti-sigma factor [Trichocoleus desertorum AS-A10]|uniref:anti-sigma factor n=1 Tax=Trichocoleus desertorum TaxID=1481672 RepID=UPI0032975731